VTAFLNCVSITAPDSGYIISGGGDEPVILLCGSDKSAQDETIKAAKRIAENLEGI
jgi:putative component of toxin-antitoxin plasmid stabilization module